ncbi:MAG: LON peptidase substrate-binding domain-containing protein, partial [Lachnospiraceae bacterium]|nr:LON peptidase substrate-binding domain-containing protein [Lachnospiraceae bacterium]
MSEGNKITINRMLPTVALRGMTVLPGAIIHFDLNREKSVAAIEQAMVTGGRVFLITQKNTEDNDPSFEQLYHVGTVALVKQITKLPNHVIRVLVEGIGRGLFTGINEENPEFIEAAVEEISGEAENDILGTDMEHKAQTEAMLRQAKEYFACYAGYYPKLGQNAMKRYADIQNLGYLIDQMAMNMPLEHTYKQKVLEAVALSERYDVFCEILINEIEVAKIRTDLTQKIKGKVDKNQKEYLLREQLRYIREELGDDDSFSDADQFEESLSALQASEEVKSKIKKEIKRFKSLSQNSSESSVERAYIETLLELPWDRVSVDNESMKRAEEILNRDHYGLEKV